MRIPTLVALLALTLACVADAQERPPDTATLLSAQREAMATFALMDGVWRGPAATTLASGDKHTITQTERIGPLLGGSVKVIEGRGYDADGSTTFNALGIISYDVRAKTFSMRSYALGHSGDFPIERTADGFTWDHPRRTRDHPLPGHRQGRHLGGGRRPPRAWPAASALFRNEADARGGLRLAAGRRHRTTLM